MNNVIWLWGDQNELCNEGALMAYCFSVASQDVNSQNKKTVHEKHVLMFVDDIRSDEKLCQGSAYYVARCSFLCSGRQNVSIVGSVFQMLY